MGMDWQGLVMLRDSNGLRLLLLNHLEECRARYDTYIRRHDELAGQIAANDDKRTEQIAQVRRDFNEAMNAQTKLIWQMIIKSLGISLLTVLGALDTAVWFVLTHKAGL